MLSPRKTTVSPSRRAKSSARAGAAKARPRTRRQRTGRLMDEAPAARSSPTVEADSARHSCLYGTRPRAPSNQRSAVATQRPAIAAGNPSLDLSVEDLAGYGFE